MARIRTIKPEFWTSEQVMELSRDARLLFIGLWNFCDDAGVHPASFKTLKAEVFPGDDIAGEEVRRMVEEIIQQGLIGEFEHDGRRWWYVTGWKHQLINRPSQSRYPRPPRIAPLPLAAGQDGISGKGLDDFAGTLTTSGDDPVHGAEPDASQATHGALTEDSRSAHGVLTEDSLQERKGKEGNVKERKGEDKEPAQQASTEVQAREEPPAADAADRFDAAEFLIEKGADRQTAADYLTLRKVKKAASTPTALRSIVSEAEKAGMPVQDVLVTCCARGWAGFKAEWAEQRARDGPRKSIHDQRRDTLDELTGRKRATEKPEPRDITAEVIRIA